MAADTSYPTLTSVALPRTIDVSTGTVYPTFTVGASDVGLGVNYVFLNLDRNIQTSTGPQSWLSFYDSQDSFSDGISKSSIGVTQNTAAGTYNITSASVSDKAGNYTYYTAAQLAALGFQTSFTVNYAPVFPLRPDANGDGKSDIVWHNKNGQSAIWSMNSNQILSGNFVNFQGSVVAPNSDWKLADTGDFNGDGRIDLLWRNDGGQLDIWTMNGSQIVASNTITQGGARAAPASDWSVASVEDFTGDGRSDILWRNTSGQLDLWTMDGAQIVASNIVTQGGAPAAPGKSWMFVDAADFNGDGRTEALWRNSSGQLDLWTMDGARIVASNSITIGGSLAAPGADWSVVGVDDFTGDGKADVLWRNADGHLDLWTMNGAQIVRSDHVTSNGTVVAPGSEWWITDVGDFNGDGHADVLWQNTNGSLDVWNMNGAQLVASNHVTQQGIGNVSIDSSWSVVG